MSMKMGGGIVFCLDSKFDIKARKGFPCYISLNFNWIDKCFIIKGLEEVFFLLFS